MPYSKRRTFRKKPAARKNGKTSRYNKTHVTTTRVPRGLTGSIPDVMLVKMKYVERISLSCILGVTDTNVFSGNSIFDPNTTGTGHQPMGHDQWSNFYKEYMVLGSSINIQGGVSTALTTYAPVSVVVHDATSTAPDTNIATILERYRSRQSQANANGGKGVFLKTYIPTAKAIGDKLGPEEEATFGTSPAHQWYWHITAGNIDALDTTSVSLIVSIIYYVKMFNRVSLPQS